MRLIYEDWFSVDGRYLDVARVETKRGRGINTAARPRIREEESFALVSAPSTIHIRGFEARRGFSQSQGDVVDAARARSSDRSKQPQTGSRRVK